MRRSIKLFLLLVLLAIPAAGCGSSGVSNEHTPAVDSPDAASGGQTKQMTIEVFYADDQLEHLISRERVISFTNMEEKLKAAFAELQKDGEAGAMSLWKHAELLSVSVKEGEATFDLSIPQESKFGAPGEQFALEAIRSTIFQFEEIVSLDLLVDGEAVESLMGHEELEHPIRK